MDLRAKIKGSLLPYLQNEVWDFDPIRGYIHSFNFKGASQPAMLGLQQDFVRAGIACRLIYHQGETAGLEVEDGTQQYTIDQWQILGNEERPDWMLHPTVQALVISDEIQDDFGTMRQGLLDGTGGDQLFENGGPVDYLQGGPVDRMYRQALAGDTAFLRPQYVLRHTTNAPNRWAVNIADFGIEKIYTPAQLLSEAQSSALWIFPLPARLAYKIANIEAPTFQPFYQWGWLKQPSTETNAPHNRIEIAQEYILYQWSTDKYEPY